MTFDQCYVGRRVVALIDGSEPGEVAALNDRDRMVWVRFPIPGSTSTALEEYDPADLVPAEEVSDGA